MRKFGVIVKNSSGTYDVEEYYSDPTGLNFKTKTWNLNYKYHFSADCFCMLKYGRSRYTNN